MAVQYSHWLTMGDVPAADAIPVGGGAILTRGLSKIAVHRDAAGALHERSAVCVHLGCMVGWNPTEKSWDCPWHGSRYDARGAIVCGPANGDLKAANGDSHE